MASYSLMHACDANAVGRKIADHPMVEEIIHSPDSPSPCNELLTHPKVHRRDKLSVVYAQHSQDRMTRGVQHGLSRGRNKLNNVEFHSLYGHLGSCKGCKICEEIWGVMRAIKRKVNPHRELRAGYIWALDMITWSHRSDEGNKYSMVLRCCSCGVFDVLELYLKSDATVMFEQWVVSLRENPLFESMPYPMAYMIRTDNDGAWSEENVAWGDMIERNKVNMYYVSPDAHAKANG